MAKPRYPLHLVKAAEDLSAVKPPDAKVREHPIMTGAQGSVGMITAQFPRFPVKTAGGNASLAQELKNSGLKFEPTKGSYGTPEDSFIVYGASRQQMFDLGHRYGQECVIHSEGGHPRHEYLYTNGDNIGRAHPSMHEFDYFPHEAPDDYYTHLPSTGGYLRLKFNFDEVRDTPMRPLVTAMSAYGAPPTGSDVQKHMRELLKSIAPSRRAHPHAYPWHDGHHDHHFIVRGTGGVLVRTKLGKAQPGEHPHMDGPPSVGNDQAAGVGVSTYAKYAAPFGSLDKSRKTDLFHYPLHGKLPDVQRLVADHGYNVYYAGGKFGRPDLVNRNYTTKHLMIYDPSPSSGGDFGERDYTDAWRQTHELAHALVHPDLNQVYGEGRRIGKLGTHRTLTEATRAVHWEWLAAHKQRELCAKIGVNIPDNVFHREVNTVMHDAVHRAVTGKFTEPSDEGFSPHDHLVPLDTSLGLVRDAAHNLGLMGSHDLLKKSDRSPDVSTQKQTYTIPEVKDRLVKALKERITAYEGEVLGLRQRELRKNDACVVCKNAPGACSCMTRLAKGEKMMAFAKEGLAGKGKKLGKDELCASCSKNPCKCEGVLPGDKDSKNVKAPGTGDDAGSGGEVKKGKALGKADVPSAKAGSPSLPKPSIKKATAIEGGGEGSTVSSAPAAPAAPAAPSSGPSPGGRGGHSVGASAGVGGRGGHVMKSESPVFQALNKAQPRLGGKDPASQMMAQHASAAAPAPGAASAAPAAPKLAPEAQAARHAQYTDFTPAGAFSAPGAGAVAGAMKPAPAAGPPTMAGVQPPPASMRGGAPVNPLQRFSDALHGRNKPAAAAPVLKAELKKSLGSCLLCRKPEHTGSCE